MTVEKQANINENEMRGSIDSFSLTVAISFLVVLVTIVLLWWINNRRKWAQRGDSLIICGLPNAGKTLLFLRLVKNMGKQTVTSSVTNRDTMILEGTLSGRTSQRIKVIDIPGNPRIRQREFNAYKNAAKAMVFVIDSTTANDESKEIADFVYDILREKTFHRQRLPLLILCNKQDLNNGNESRESIQRLLENELTMKRRTRASSVAVHQGKSEQVEDIGRPGKETFEFSDVKNFQIEFLDGSALGIERESFADQYEPEDDEEIGSAGDETEGEVGVDIDGVYQWIEKIWVK